MDEQTSRVWSGQKVLKGREVLWSEQYEYDFLIFSLVLHVSYSHTARILRQKHQ